MSYGHKLRDTSTVEGLNAFDGRITADAVKAVAKTSANASTISTSAAGTNLVNLVVDGQPVSADVAPNTRLDLPGIGSVTIKKVSKSGQNGKRSITVEAITINVSEVNTFGLPVGSRIVIGHATAGFSRTEPNVIVGGTAYAATTNASVGNALQNQIGRAAAVYIGCEGTNGKTRTNNIENLAAGTVLSLGTGQTTAFGGPTTSGTVAETTATVENAGLLNGLIQADTMKAVAKDTFANGQRTSSTEGTQFVNLRVAGVPVAANVQPNTRINLPGIGYVIVNEQQVPAPTSRMRTVVNGLHVFVTKSNTLGLPVGAEIIVAHADSTAVRY